jgi:hypothetical protein
MTAYETPRYWFRFRLYTLQEGQPVPSAYCSVIAADQPAAVSALHRQLQPWEYFIPLHGPSVSAGSFY